MVLLLIQAIPHSLHEFVGMTWLLQEIDAFDQRWSFANDVCAITAGMMTFSRGFSPFNFSASSRPIMPSQEISLTASVWHGKDTITLMQPKRRTSTRTKTHLAIEEASTNLSLPQVVQVTIFEQRCNGCFIALPPGRSAAANR
jgi:hypothetical protein